MNTRILGFSVTHQFYVDGALEALLPNPEEWELLSRNGADLHEWANPNAAVYSSAVHSSTGSPPERAIFHVAFLGKGTVPTVVTWLQNALGVIRSKWPSIDVIELIPVVGGPAHAVCPVGGGACNMHNTKIDPAIVEVMNGTDILAGPDLLVEDCSQFVDPKGHLNLSGALAVANQVAEFYAP